MFCSIFDDGVAVTAASDSNDTVSMTLRCGSSWSPSNVPPNVTSMDKGDDIVSNIVVDLLVLPDHSI